MIDDSPERTGFLNPSKTDSVVLNGYYFKEGKCVMQSVFYRAVYLKPVKKRFNEDFVLVRKNLWQHKATSYFYELEIDKSKKEIFRIDIMTFEPKEK